MKTLSILICMLALVIGASSQQFEEVKFSGIPNDSPQYTLKADRPTITKLDNGYTIQYSYTLTATANGAGRVINPGWSSTRPFTLAGGNMVNYMVRINGTGTLKMSDGSLAIGLVGDNDGMLNVAYSLPEFLEGTNINLPLKWKDSSETGKLKPGRQYSLRMLFGQHWIPKAANDTLTISATYTITLLPGNPPAENDESWR